MTNKESKIKNENEFWEEIEDYDQDFLKPESIAKKTSNIENAVSQGTISTYRQLEKATNIDENVIRAFAKYSDHPFLGPIIMKYIIAQRQNEGWIVDELKDFYKLHSESIKNELFSKKVKKALGKLQDKIGFG